MTFSFAAIPLPVLIGVPIVGIVAAVLIYEYEKNKKAQAAAAAAAALQQPVVASPPVGAKAPVGATGPVTAGSVALAAAALEGRLVSMGAVKPGANVPIMFVPSKPSAPANTNTSTPNAATTGFGPQIVTAAQQAYAALGAAPPSTDFIDSFNYQTVVAALSQLQNNPTSAQLSSAMAALTQNASSYATTANSYLSRVYQVIAA